MNCVYVCSFVRVTAPMEIGGQPSGITSLNCVGPGDQTQVSRYSYLLSHLTSPSNLLLDGVAFGSHCVFYEKCRHVTGQSR